MTNLKIPFVDLKKINSKYKKKFLTYLSSAIKGESGKLESICLIDEEVYKYQNVLLLFLLSG